MNAFNMGMTLSHEIGTSEINRFYIIAVRNLKEK